MNDNSTLLLKLIVLGVLFSTIGLMLWSPAHADANNGEYLGFRLGDKWEKPPKLKGRPHITGALVFDLDPGNHPHHVDMISLYVSPVSLIIGSVFGEWYFPDERAAKSFADRYIAKLEQKYAHWRRSGRSLTDGHYQLWVEVERRPAVTEAWYSRDEYRVGIALIYAPDSAYRGEWMTVIGMEVENLELTARK